MKKSKTTQTVFQKDLERIYQRLENLEEFLPCLDICGNPGLGRRHFITWNRFTDKFSITTISLSDTKFVSTCRNHSRSNLRKSLGDYYLFPLTTSDLNTVAIKNRKQEPSKAANFLKRKILKELSVELLNDKRSATLPDGFEDGSFFYQIFCESDKLRTYGRQLPFSVYDPDSREEAVFVLDQLQKGFSYSLTDPELIGFGSKNFLYLFEKLTQKQGLSVKERLEFLQDRIVELIDYILQDPDRCFEKPFYNVNESAVVFLIENILQHVRLFCAENAVALWEPFSEGLSEKIGKLAENRKVQQQNWTTFLKKFHGKSLLILLMSEGRDSLTLGFSPTEQGTFELPGKIVTQAYSSSLSNDFTLYLTIGPSLRTTGGYTGAAAERNLEHLQDAFPKIKLDQTDALLLEQIQKNVTLTETQEEGLRLLGELGS